MVESVGEGVTTVQPGEKGTGEGGEEVEENKLISVVLTSLQVTMLFHCTFLSVGSVSFARAPKLTSAALSGAHSFSLWFLIPTETLASSLLCAVCL